MSTADAVPGGALAARALRAAGVRTLFGLPGGHVMPLLVHGPREGLRVLTSRHEENAVFMAEGWALSTGEVGLAAVTAGPGLANALPGLAEADAAGVPVVVVAGRTAVRQRDRGAVQDLDQLAVVAPVTKWRAECLDAARIPEYVAEAVHQARSGAPGVAYLEIPQDVLASSALPPERAWATGHDDAPARSVPVAGDLDRAIDVLGRAERPVVVAGSGAFFSGAGDALRAFAERTGIPVTTTSAARGLLDDDHPRCLGSMVHGGVAVASADACLVLGSRFNANTLYGGPPLFSSTAAIVQVDVRPEHLGGLRRADVALAGDVAATLEAMAERWPGEPDGFGAWAEYARRGAATSLSTWDQQCERPANGIHPGVLAREVARFADEHGAGAFVSDGGDSVVWGLAYSRAHRPGSNLFIGSAMGTLGIGLPFAVAAKTARPEDPVFLFTGDGAFGMSAMELDTAARAGLGIVVVVVNNGGWGDVRHEVAAEYGEADAAAERPSSMRYDLLARAVGGHGERVAAMEEVGPALARALEAAREGRPAVIDALTDPDVVNDLMANLGGMAVM